MAGRYFFYVLKFDFLGSATGFAKCSHSRAGRVRECNKRFRRAAKHTHSPNFMPLGPATGNEIEANVNQVVKKETHHE